MGPLSRATAFLLLLAPAARALDCSAVKPDARNPVTGPRGYVIIQEYWAESVQRYFTSRDWLKGKDPKTFAFVARKLQEAEKSPLEAVRLPLDAGRCANAR